MASEAGRALAHFRSMFCDFVAELGDCSTLFLHTKAVPNPCELRTRAIAKNAPSTLQLYLRSWSGWVSHATRSGLDPADPPPGSVPQWLQLTSAPSGLSTSSFKALSWMARVAGLPSLHSQLQTLLCPAFLSATGPVEKREALPFSVSFVAWLERRIMDRSCPIPESSLGPFSASLGPRSAGTTVYGLLRPGLFCRLVRSPDQKLPRLYALGVSAPGFDRHVRIVLGDLLVERPSAVRRGHLSAFSGPRGGFLASGLIA